MDEEKLPWHSLRVHLGESTAQKTLGMITRSVELTYGNQNERTVEINEDDVVDIATKQLPKEIWDKWDEITKEGHHRGQKFAEDFHIE